VARHGRRAARHGVARIVKSTGFALGPAGTHFYLTGPDTSYHRLDAALADVLARYWPEVRLEDVAAFHRTEAAFDLCFEDGWSGLFVARALERRPLGENLVLVHLDDHTDMMPTLLQRRTDGLFDPATGRGFDPAEPDDWRGALTSGAISIGSFVTALCQGPRRVHVRHLNNVARSTHAIYPTARSIRRYDLVPGVSFAALRKYPPGRQGDAGSYRGGANPSRLLDDLPPGRVIVHVDLDYLINDFNGNAGTADPVPDETLMRIARGKLDRFFKALADTERPVDRWIIGTSPGFCSARHWPGLLDAIRRENERRGES
jgi:hypothetical protein